MRRVQLILRRAQVLHTGSVSGVSPFESQRGGSRRHPGGHSDAALRPPAPAQGGFSARRDLSPPILSDEARRVNGEGDWLDGCAGAFRLIVCPWAESGFTALGSLVLLML
jgi:hypothetical protein